MDRFSHSAYRYHHYGRRPESKSTETGQFKPIFGTGMPQGNVNPVIFAGHNTTQTFGYFNAGAPVTNFHTDYEQRADISLEYEPMEQEFSYEPMEVDDDFEAMDMETTFQNMEVEYI